MVLAGRAGLARVGLAHAGHAHAVCAQNVLLDRGVGIGGDGRGGDASARRQVGDDHGDHDSAHAPPPPSRPAARVLVRMASPGRVEPLDLPQGECMVTRAPMHAARGSRFISEGAAPMIVGAVYELETGKVRLLQ